MLEITFGSGVGFGAGFVDVLDDGGGGVATVVLVVFLGVNTPPSPPEPDVLVDPVLVVVLVPLSAGKLAAGGGSVSVVVVVGKLAAGGASVSSLEKEKSTPGGASAKATVKTETWRSKIKDTIENIFFISNKL